MTKPAWTDIDHQGRNVNKKVNLCNTMVHNLMFDGKDLRPVSEMDHDLIIAYLNTGLKAEKQLESLTNTNLKLNMLFKLAEKKHADEIVSIGLKELSDKKK